MATRLEIRYTLCLFPQFHDCCQIVAHPRDPTLLYSRDELVPSAVDTLSQNSLWTALWDTPRVDIARDLDFVVERDMDAGW